MSVSTDRAKVTMIDGSVGNDYSVSLCAALHANGVDVELIAPENRILTMPAAYPIHRWMPTKDAGRGKIGKATAYLAYLARLLVHLINNRREHRFAHFQFFRRERVECVFFMLLRLLGIRPVFTAHDILPHENSALDRILRRGVYGAAGQIIVHSDYMKNKLVSSFRIPPEKVAVIPCGSFDHYVPEVPVSRVEARASLNLSETDRVILFFGFIREYKGLDMLLDAFQIAQEQRDGQLRLLIAGAAHPPELESRYRMRIEQMAENGSIQFHAGFVPSEKVASYFVASDAVILPYRETDHSGIVHLAYSFARPVIATDVGDMSDVIEHGRSGYILAENSADCLARTMIGAFSAVPGLGEMGIYARQLSEEKYAWHNIARQTEGLYLALRRAA